MLSPVPLSVAVRGAHVFHGGMRKNHVPNQSVRKVLPARGSADILFVTSDEPTIPPASQGVGVLAGKGLRASFLRRPELLDASVDVGQPSTEPCFRLLCRH